MQDDSEAIQKSLLKLLQDLALIDSPTELEQFNLEAGSSSKNADDQVLGDLDPLDSEEVSSAPTGHIELQNFSFQGEQPLKPGEIPVVQDRFHALLKRRLQTEIQHHPPLFPWETELTDYETDSLSPGLQGVVSPTAPQPVPVASIPEKAAIRPKIPALLWTTQLQNLNLPVSMPETVLAQLLEQCQEAVQSSLREGAKLVRAVESLFPGQSQSLNHLAGLVLASPVRSGVQNQPKLSVQAGNNFPSSYDAAVPAQQMVLSLLAAREIIGSLTLAVSPNRPPLERQWLTAAGVITLQVDYLIKSDGSQLRIQARFPCGGRLNLRAGETQAMTQRADAGLLGVELHNLQPNQTYPLEVQFQAIDQSPLIFAIRPTAE